jgi:hypothetical protein
MTEAIKKRKYEGAEELVELETLEDPQDLLDFYDKKRSLATL